MDLKDIQVHYLRKMTQIHLYQRAMRALASKELDSINNLDYRFNLKPEIKEKAYSHHNMSYKKAIDGKDVFFGKTTIGIDEHRLSVHLHTNKQYQWLLAEAYEEFEDCLELLYAYAGMKDINFWPLCDYGNISISELKNKNFDWYLTKAKDKKGSPRSIINSFRSSYPNIKLLETKNALGIDLNLAITLVEHMRHVIVHRAGVVHDKARFTENVLKKSGLFNSGNPSSTNIEFIESYFDVHEQKTIILLIEQSVQLSTHIVGYYNIFDTLSGFLMTYVDIIVEQLREKTTTPPS